MPSLNRQFNLAISIERFSCLLHFSNSHDQISQSVGADLNWSICKASRDRLFKLGAKRIHQHDRIRNHHINFRATRSFRRRNLGSNLTLANFLGGLLAALQFGRRIVTVVADQLHGIGCRDNAVANGLMDFFRSASQFDHLINVSQRHASFCGDLLATGAMLIPSGQVQAPQLNRLELQLFVAGSDTHFALKWRTFKLYGVDVAVKLWLDFGILQVCIESAMTINQFDCAGFRICPDLDRGDR